MFVDIGQTLLFQLVHCQKAHPKKKHVLVGAGGDSARADFLYCPSDQLHLLDSLDFDIAVNVASMQEMAPATVAAYFTFLRQRLRRANLFYCCNRESKRLAGGELSEFARYPWRPDDRIVVDGPCPWHEYFFTLGRASRGPSVMGVRVPFVAYYDGRHLHRLAVLQTERI